MSEARVKNNNFAPSLSSTFPGCSSTCVRSCRSSKTVESHTFDKLKSTSISRSAHHATANSDWGVYLNRVIYSISGRIYWRYTSIMHSMFDVCPRTCSAFFSTLFDVCETYRIRGGRGKYLLLPIIVIGGKPEDISKSQAKMTSSYHVAVLIL